MGRRWGDASPMFPWGRRRWEGLTRVVMGWEVRVRGDSPGFPWDRRWRGRLTRVSVGQEEVEGPHEGCHAAGGEG